TSAPVVIQAGQASSQTISFSPLSNATYGDVVTLSASASSGLTVSYSVISGPATLAGNSLTITGVGAVTVRASQAGNASFNPAPDVDRSFTGTPKLLTATFTVNSKTYDGTASAAIAS